MVKMAPHPITAATHGLVSRNVDNRGRIRIFEWTVVEFGLSDPADGDPPLLRRRRLRV